MALGLGFGGTDKEGGEMLRWLIGNLRRRRDKRRRLIFHFYDGSSWRQCDPVETLLRLQSHPKYDYRLHPKMVDEGDMEAIKITCDAVRFAFDIKPFDPATETGLTIAEVLETLAEFSVYCEVLKKSTNLPATSLLPSELTSSESDSQITNDTSASGSIAIAPSSATPTASAVP